VVDALGKL